MSRILIVSNRLPVTVTLDEGKICVERSAGGVATGLRTTHEQGEGLWIGWSGFTGPLSEEQQAEVERQFRDQRLVQVVLSPEDAEQYYEGYCNGLLWPLFHGFLGQLPLDVSEWSTYELVNQRFAEIVAAEHRPGDLIWVHDYQLMLVPQLVRQRIPSARIGFFLHIPFPPSESFRTLPARERLLEGMLAADVIGFHTAAYMRNFASSALLVLGASTNIDCIGWKGRTSSVGVFPMGVDAKAVEATARSQEVTAEVEALHGATEEQFLVGIDRLDYTKGIPRRLLAYERLLERHPELHGRVRLVQVAAPSRTRVDAYIDFRHQVDALVGRINGRFGSPQWTPVHYVVRAIGEADVMTLYRAAAVMLVTPIKDGMNLVAKEFCAARFDEDGVLVISEFAGAAAELAEALHVNPYDLERVAEVMHDALTLPRAERRTRMAALRRRVRGYNVHRWARTFLSALEEASGRPDHVALLASSEGEVERAVLTMAAASRLLLLLDYDGTLMPIVATPDLAQPDDELLALLGRLAKRPGISVHVVSGRSRDTLEAWLGELAIGLHAEHGFWSRGPAGGWVGRETLPNAWRHRALDILMDFAQRAPGSLVEEKQSGLAWHFRMCDPEFGAAQANELRVHLTALLSNAPVELLAGDKVIELRPHGSNKGRVATELVTPGVLTAAFGDDVTDEELFVALPPDALSFHLGPAPSVAKLRLESWRDVRKILSRLTT